MIPVSDMQLPDVVRSALADFAKLVPEDSREMEELILRALALVHARRAARGIVPPEWIVGLPCYPPTPEDVRLLLETLGPVVCDRPEGQRWIAGTETLLREMEGTQPTQIR